MRKHMVGLAFLGLLATATTLQAQTTLGPTVAWEDDLDVGIGATLRLPLASVATGVGLMGDFLIFFPTGSDYYEVSGNLTYDLPLDNSTLMPFLLAGLTIGRSSADAADDSGTDTAARLNIGGGLEFNAGTLRPTAGVRIELGDGDNVVAFLSVPFALGN